MRKQPMIDNGLAGQASESEVLSTPPACDWELDYCCTPSIT